MVAPVSVSKSVARAFALLELFREQRRGLTAAEITRQLGIPQPSARALIKNLVALGYLRYEPGQRRYLPSLRVAELGDWLRARPTEAAAFAGLVESVCAATGETASLATLNDTHVEILACCRARHPVALQLETGIGALAWRSTAGRLLLSRLAAAERKRAFEKMHRTERRPAARRELDRVAAALGRAGQTDWLAGYDLLLEGVGAVCLALPGPVPLVLTVAGLRERIRARERQILRAMRHAVRQHAA